MHRCIYVEALAQHRQLRRMISRSLVDELDQTRHVARGSLGRVSSKFVLQVGAAEASPVVRDGRLARLSLVWLVPLAECAKSSHDV
jgi:hypothetical protein